jgi:hypothetical protein
MLVTAVLGIVLFAVAASGRGGFWALAVPQFLFISALAFNFSNGFALGLRRSARPPARPPRYSVPFSF